MYQHTNHLCDRDEFDRILFNTVKLIDLCADVCWSEGNTQDGYDKMGALFDAILPMSQQLIPMNDAINQAKPEDLSQGESVDLVNLIAEMSAISFRLSRISSVLSYLSICEKKLEELPSAIEAMTTDVKRVKFYIDTTIKVFEKKLSAQERNTVKALSSKIMESLDL